MSWINVGITAPSYILVVGLLYGVLPKRVGRTLYFLVLSFVVVDAVVSYPTRVTTATSAISIIGSGNLVMNTSVVRDPLINLPLELSTGVGLQLMTLCSVIFCIVFVYAIIKAFKSASLVILGLIMTEVILLVTVWVQITFIYNMSIVEFMESAKSGSMYPAVAVLAVTISVFDIVLGVFGPYYVYLIFRSIGLYKKVPNLWRDEVKA